MITEPKDIVENDEVSIKEQIVIIQTWIRYLYSKWLILLIAGLLGGVVGLWYAFNKKPTYIATTTFVVESGDSKGGLGKLAGMAAMAGVDLGVDAGGLFQGDNILELYRSRRMLVQTLLTPIGSESDELLIERYLSYTGLREVWTDIPELSTLDFRRDQESLDMSSRRLRDSILTNVSNNIRSEILTVDKPDKNLSIIRVVVMSPDEVFSKVFNENLVREVNEFYIQTKTKKSVTNIEILQTKADSVRRIMTDAIYSAAKVNDATPNLNPTRQVQRIAPSQESQFSAEANRAILTQLLQNLEFTKMMLLQEQPLIQLVDQPVYPLKIERLGKIRAIVICGFLFGMLAMLWLIGARYYKLIMAGQK